MRKGITNYFGFKLEPETAIKLIHEAGFDAVITNADPRLDDENGPIEKQVELFKKNNLTVTSLHQKYITAELPEFWNDSEIGKKLEANLIDDVLIAAKYNFPCVVVHLIGETSEFGFKRLERILEVCKKNNVPLAIENLDNQKLFVEVMERFKDNEYAKVCYDSGHNHVFDPDFDYLTLYRDKIICLHLHDNMGKVDQHTLNKYGNTNWDELAKRLAKVPNIKSLDYEMLFYTKVPETAEEVLKETYAQACELERKINEYRG